MAGNNRSLHEANRAKKDEFYTQLNDIANEVKHYWRHFEGKTVLCNCDDPYESNFTKYFLLMFNTLHLKKLICTCYAGSPILGSELNLFDEAPAPDGRRHKAYHLEITEVRDINEDTATDLDDVRLFLEAHPPTLLNGSGDFRSEECVELLREADIVVTNPPFSLFREYVAQLVQYDKKFLIIGNKNAVTYKEIFPLIKENKMWVGVTPMTKDLHFIVPQYYIDTIKADQRATAMAVDDGKELGRSPAIWFTNMEHSKRHEPLVLYKHYSAEEYPRYDNYDAIEVPQTKLIPMDYDGVMGVPITFLDKYCPDQFEIVGCLNHGKDNIYDLANTNINGVPTYKRIAIRHKHPTL